MVHLFHLRALIGLGHRHGIGTGIITFNVATKLDPSPQLGVPERITGKLVSNLNPELLRKLRSPYSEVAFEGRGYRVTKIEAGGSVEFSIVVPPY
jgi:hypothetical protein